MDGCVGGFHVYQDVWMAIIVEVLACQRETTNMEDRYAIAINKMEEVVGHALCKISFLLIMLGAICDFAQFINCP